MTNAQIGYFPDLAQITLDEFSHELQTGRLLPSRRPLLDGIDAKFASLAAAGIGDLAALKSALANPKGLSATAARTGLDLDYLKLLRREVNSLLPTPVAFREVPNIEDEILLALDDIGIADTAALFPHIRDSDARTRFAAETGLASEQVLWLAKLTDVARIKWTGPKLARLIIDTEFDTVARLAAADPVEALAAFKTAKANHKAYDGALGIDDIESWIRQVIRKMPLVIDFSEPQSISR